MSLNLDSSPSLDDIVSTFGGGLRLSVRAKPAARRARAVTVVDIGEGKQALEVAVAAVPQEGKANKALAEKLAELFDVKNRDVTLKTGAQARLKCFEIAGDPVGLRQRLADALGQNPETQEK